MVQYFRLFCFVLLFNKKLLGERVNKIIDSYQFCSKCQTSNKYCTAPRPVQYSSKEDSVVTEEGSSLLNKICILKGLQVQLQVTPPLQRRQFPSHKFTLLYRKATDLKTDCSLLRFLYKSDVRNAHFYCRKKLSDLKLEN